MSNPNIKEAEDLKELQSAAETLLVKDLHLIFVNGPAANDLRDALKRAYSLGYDAAQADCSDGTIG